MEEGFSSFSSLSILHSSEDSHFCKWEMSDLNFQLKEIFPPIEAGGNSRRSGVRCPQPRLFRGFVCSKHCSYPSELFNLKPQGLGLGLTSQSAYVFSDNIVLKGLRLVNQGFCKPPLQMPSGVKRWVVDVLNYSLSPLWSYTFSTKDNALSLKGKLLLVFVNFKLTKPFLSAFINKKQFFLCYNYNMISTKESENP